MKRLFLTISMILFCAGLCSAELTVESLLKKHQEASSKLEDVKAKAALSLQVVVGIIPYSEKLSGRYYYLKPDRHRLEFDDAPSYFDKAPSLFKWDLPTQDKYRTKVKGPFKEATGEVYQLLYLPKDSDSSTQSVLCSFDSKTWRLLRQETAYRDGGSVALSFKYLTRSEVPVLDKVAANVKIPSYSLSGAATISFTDQKYNQGLDESIFPTED